MNILGSVLITSKVPSTDIGVFLLLLAIALVLGVLNMLVFRAGNNKMSTGLSMTLALLPVAVTVVIMLVNDKLGAGVAVAGAFSLVRFRSIAGTAREIAAIFVCVVLGAALGMGYIAAAVILFILVAAVCLCFTLLPSLNRKATRRQLRITIPENLDYNGLFDETFRKYSIRADLIRIRSTTMGTLFELTYDITLPGDTVPKAFVDDLRVLNLNQTITVGLMNENDML
ncbi:MAG: DUF4956 domain-containing protein [Clostridiales bacterium]|nr:DUF4956 domain-containing protein [Clostridiales bacterium]